MKEEIKAVHIRRKEEPDALLAGKFGVEKAKAARRFHQSFPQYQETPLHALEGLAKALGVSGIYVKDESKRFGLNAFKGLGGSYCIGRYIAERLHRSIDTLHYQQMKSEEVKGLLGDITFVTATDGNHGRGIAWTARELGVNAVVYMPKGSSKERLENIRALGAKAEITPWNYDDTVNYAAECEKKYGWVLVQDTTLEGYETIPAWIMEGYTTMADEAVQQLAGVKPTHIFLQAGVGAMAGALTGFFMDYYKGETPPTITIVEPDKADCIYKTAAADDGTLHRVTGNMDTIMAGLACGVPCSIGWEQLHAYAEHFVSIPDWVAAKGMRILGNPVEGDARIISGESGAATMGFVAELLQNESLRELKNTLHLDAQSKILCISTEGDTDIQSYRRIVWDGNYSSK